MIYIATENIENIDVARVQEHYRALSVYRKTKADKSDKNYKKYCQSVEAAYLLEKTLQDKFGIPMGTAEYETGEHGKPFIKGRPDIVFNMSHTENAVMAAFAIDEVGSDGAPCVSVGCDIEVIKERPADRRLAEKYFSKEEAECVMRKGEFDTEAFLRIWTIKESFGKALGTGLAYSLHDIRVAFDRDGNMRFWQEVFDGEVVFSTPRTENSDCVASVCVLYGNRKG